MSSLCSCVVCSLGKYLLHLYRAIGLFPPWYVARLTQARHSAAKREKKTRSSLTQVAGEKSDRRALGIATTKPQLSKSALRRQKHKQRDQLAGNKEGLQDLERAVTSLEEDIPDHEEPEAPPAAPTTISAKAKKRMLYVVLLTQCARTRAPALYPC